MCSGVAYADPRQIRIFEELSKGSTTYQDCSSSSPAVDDEFQAASLEEYECGRGFIASSPRVGAGEASLRLQRLQWRWREVAIAIVESTQCLSAK